MKIILASASLGRKKLLEDLGLKFEVMPANIDEEKITAPSPILLVKKIAKAKALVIKKKLVEISNIPNNPIKDKSARGGTKFLRNERALCPPGGFCTRKNFRADLSASYLVIAADSMVLFNGQTYGKPKSRSQAIELLKMLSGQTHEFLTGLCVIDLNTHKIYQRAARSRVIFQKFTNKEIEDHVKNSAVTSHAGAYSIDDELIKKRFKLMGSETNVIGLPLEKLLPILDKIGLKINSSH